MSIKYTPITVSLGELPEQKDQVVEYPLSNDVPSSATSVFIYAFATTHNEGPFQRGYYTMLTKEDDVNYSQYMNIATGEPSVAINSSNMWFPLATDRKIYISLTHPSDKSVAHKKGLAQKSAGALTNLTGEWSQVFIIGYK